MNYSKLLNALQNDSVIIRVLNSTFDTLTTIDTHDSSEHSLKEPAASFKNELIKFLKSKDVEFVRKRLTDYDVIAHPTYTDGRPGQSVRCVSSKGLSDYVWPIFVTEVKRYFDGRFLEIYHNVNYMHTDFVIYLKN